MGRKPKVLPYTVQEPRDIPSRALQPSVPTLAPAFSKASLVKIEDVSTAGE